MRFYVIYSVDVPKGEHLNYYRPCGGRVWTMTEADESEYSYLGEDWERGSRHRKWTAELAREQFDRFIDNAGLYAHDVETLGSLTVEHGWLPAISFGSDSECAIVDAYVTPLPETVNDAPLDERNWRRIRDTVVNAYQP